MSKALTHIFWWGQLGSEIWMCSTGKASSLFCPHDLPLQYFCISSIEVAKIGVSLLNFISSGEWFFGTLSEPHNLQVTAKNCSVESIRHSTLNRLGKQFLLFLLQTMQMCFVLDQQMLDKWLSMGLRKRFATVSRAGYKYILYFLCPSC